MKRALIFAFIIGCGHRPLGPLPTKITGFESDHVPASGPVVLRCAVKCGAPSSFAAEPFVNGAFDPAGAVTFKATLADKTTITLKPETKLAPRMRYRLRLPKDFAGPELVFETEEAVQAPAPNAVMWPRADAPVAANVAWLLVFFDVPVERAGVLDLVLASGDTIIAPRWIVTDAGETVQQAVLWGPFADPTCASGMASALCPGRDYTLKSRSGIKQPDGVALFDVATFRAGAVEDDPLLWLGDGTVAASDTALAIVRPVMRPCLLRAVEAADSIENINNVEFSEGKALIVGLTPATTYHWSFMCVDAAGHATRPWVIDFTTQPAIHVRLNEVVVDPQFDWNDSTAQAGAPFDASPGSDRAQTNDEWAEIDNQGTSPVDVSGWTLEIGNASKSETPLTAGPPFETLWRGKPSEAFVRDGDLSLRPGAKMVVRLSTAARAAPNHAIIVLKDGWGLERDRVILGEGDVPDGKAAGAADEAVARCQVTSGEAVWKKTRATPGDENACPASP